MAKALAALPLIRESFGKGVISYSKVRAMSRVATADNEDYLLMVAMHGTAAHVETVVRGYRRAKADLELDEANQRHERRQLRWYFDDEDMLVVKARLALEDGTRFINAIERVLREVEVERGDEPEAVAHVPTETSRADALMHAIVERPDTEIQVHVTAETLAEFDSRGCCHLHDGPNLAPHTVRRLSCDAGIVRIVEDANGQPLDVGRKTRSFPAALKRALAARDRGCRFPGCGMTRHLHGLHIEHWADGGVTALDNLVQLCPHHHRLVHEGGFAVRLVNAGVRAGQVFQFHRPDGVMIKDMVPRLAVDGCGEALLKQHNAQLGLVIDETTA